MNAKSQTKRFPVGKDNACFHLSLLRVTQFGQETHELTVCLTVPATTQETEPCLTSYGIVRASYEAMTDHEAKSPAAGEKSPTANREHVSGVSVRQCQRRDGQGPAVAFRK